MWHAVLQVMGGARAGGAATALSSRGAGAGAGAGADADAGTRHARQRSWWCLAGPRAHGGGAHGSCCGLDLSRTQVTTRACLTSSARWSSATCARRRSA
jgi:hypothetical protein